MIQNLSLWLEENWVTPSYGGIVLILISIAYFGAATNTMSGWLYVISGISFALMGVGAILPVRSLQQLKLSRNLIQPVTVGDQLTIEIEITNQSKQPKTLLEITDLIPFVLGETKTIPIETILPQQTYKLTYYQETKKRGVHVWEKVNLRTGTPLGLCWCSRSREKVEAKAIVYPTVLPLSRCPLIDDIGLDESSEYDSTTRRAMANTAGITRALRPYRIGDPTRLIHWKTSARYGDLKVRELEIFHGGEEIIISLDTASEWADNDFEEAVIAAASLYFYANRSQLNVKLWTAKTGLINGNRVVLETLAATHFNQDDIGNKLPNLPVIWLTQNSTSLNRLLDGSRYLLWGEKSSDRRNIVGMKINQEQPLQLQLQSFLSNQ